MKHRSISGCWSLLFMASMALMTACPVHSVGPGPDSKPGSTSAKGSRVDSGSRKLQAERLPVPLNQEVYLGMPLAEFKRSPRFAGLTLDTSFSFRIEVVDSRPRENVAEITYYFDVDLPDQPLYELIVEFSPEFDLAAATAALGPPNHGEEWEFEVGAPFPMRIWSFDRKVVYAAIMAGTEWKE